MADESTASRTLEAIETARTLGYRDGYSDGLKHARSEAATSERLRTAALLVLDSVDYTAGNCRVNEMVGAVLPRQIIAQLRNAVYSLPTPPVREQP